MKIDFNDTECAAMEEFIKGNNEVGRDMQKKFIDDLLKTVRSGEEYCPCKQDCEIHGKCMLCVQVHRGHGNHLPFCMQLMFNKKLASICELSEGSIISHLKKPDYLESCTYDDTDGGNKNECV